MVTRSLRGRWSAARRRRLLGAWLAGTEHAVADLVAALDTATPHPARRPDPDALAAASRAAHHAGAALRTRWPRVPDACGLEAAVLLGAIERLEELLPHLPARDDREVQFAVRSCCSAVRAARGSP